MQEIRVEFSLSFESPKRIIVFCSVHCIGHILKVNFPVVKSSPVFVVNDQAR